MFNRVFEFLGSHFAWVFLFSMALALILPEYEGAWLEQLVLPTLMLVMFFSMLNVETKEVFGHLRKPKLLMWLLFVSLILIPMCSYFIFSFFGEEWAIAFFLLGAVPAGMSTPALSHLFKGNVSLSLPLTILGHLFLPFTMVGMLSLFDYSGVQLSLLDMFVQLCLLIVIPLVLSEFLKRLMSKQLKAFKPYISGSVVLLLSFFIYLVLSPQGDLLFESPDLSLKILLVLTFYFFCLFVLGYVVVFKRPKSEKVTSMIGMGFMNNGLAIALAFEWFSSEVILICVLSEIIWLLAPLPLKMILNRSS